MRRRRRRERKIRFPWRIQTRRNRRYINSPTRNARLWVHSTRTRCILCRYRTKVGPSLYSGIFQKGRARTWITRSRRLYSFQDARRTRTRSMLMRAMVFPCQDYARKNYAEKFGFANLEGLVTRGTTRRRWRVTRSS